MQNLVNKESAARLFIFERTVKFHVSALLAKFGVRSRRELTREGANVLPPRGPLGGASQVEIPALSAQALVAIS